MTTIRVSKIKYFMDPHKIGGRWVSKFICGHIDWDTPGSDLWKTFRVHSSDQTVFIRDGLWIDDRKHEFTQSTSRRILYACATFNMYKRKVCNLCEFLWILQTISLWATLFALSSQVFGRQIDIGNGAGWKGSFILYDIYLIRNNGIFNFAILWYFFPIL